MKDMELGAGSGRRAPMQILATAGLLIVAMVVVVLLQQHHPTRAPASTASVLMAAPATATPLAAVPSEDLTAANLTGASALVTPFQMVASDGTGKTL
jgi:hypothetical protein